MMSAPLNPIIRAGIWAALAPVGLYVTFLALGATPFFQRQ